CSESALNGSPNSPGTSAPANAISRKRCQGPTAQQARIQPPPQLAHTVGSKVQERCRPSRPTTPTQHTSHTEVRAASACVVKIGYDRGFGLSEPAVSMLPSSVPR